MAPASFRACTGAAPAMPAESERALDATMLLRTGDGIGSAVVISPDGLLLTAAHVARHGPKALIGKDGTKYAVELLRIDDRRDVALLRAKGGREGDFPCLPIASGRAPMGSEIYVIGSPAGEELSFSISRGIVSGRRRVRGTEFLQTDASINPGNSGGPFVDGSGAVVGIASWKLAGRALEGLGFGVPADTALQAVNMRPDSASSPHIERAIAPAPAAQGFRDEPDSPWLHVDKSPVRVHPWAGPVADIGWALFITGAALETVELVTAESGTPVTSLDAVWIGTAGFGLAMILTAYIVPALDRGGDDPLASETGLRLRAVAGPGTIAVHGAF